MFMKKTLFSFIALFTLGQAAMAQTLTSSCQLKEDASSSPSTQKSTSFKADASATPYWVDAKSYYDSTTGRFTPEDGSYNSFQTSLTFDGTKVAMEGFVDTGDLKLSSIKAVEGTYDAAAKTITFNTPGYSEDRAVSDYTQYGEVTYYGEGCSVVLFAGDFSTTSGTDGQYGLETTDQLVFDVSDDLTTLTPRTGFGLWVFSNFSGTPVGCINFYQKGTISIEKMTEEPKLAFLPSSIHLEGPNVTVGSTIKQPVKIVNKGLTATNYSCDVEGEGMEFAAYRDIDAATVQEVYVRLIPTQAGDFAGTVQAKASTGGSLATLNVTAKVGEAPDFSQIVKEGDITFNIGNDFPFVITDTITGYPVAVSTNKGRNTSSSLYANINIPDGKIGVVSWKGIKQGSYGNGISIQKDGEYIFDDAYTHGMDGLDFVDKLDNMVALQPGTHVLQFQNFTNNDWDGTGDVRYRAYIYDLALRIYDQQAHQAVLKTETLDFGDHYLDRLSVRDTLTATVLNIGTEPLSLTSIDGYGAFSGVMNDSSAVFGEELPVQIAYESSELGTQDNSVMVYTNGGFYTVACKASNSTIPVDYHPIVSSGDFSFNTSVGYPFSVEGNKAFNSTATMTNDGNLDLNSFLEASFEVPEGKVGVLGWTAHNSSTDWLIFMKDTVMTTGTRITIDGEKKMEFAGEDADASSSNYKPEDLEFGQGRHTLRFFYIKKDSQPSYDDRLEISNLSVTFTDDVKGVAKANGEAVRTEYYTVGGQRIAQPQPGINLVKTIYADGTSRTVKVLK